MPDTALAQVENRIVTILDAYPALSTWNVMLGEGKDIAVEARLFPALIVTTVAMALDHNFELGGSATLHTATIEVEAITDLPASGTISRANYEALAHVNAAIAADRTLGIGLQDIQEMDVASVEPEGRDTDSASLQFEAEFHTPRDDWFTIIA